MSKNAKREVALSSETEDADPDFDNSPKGKKEVDVGKLLEDMRNLQI